MSVFYDEMAQLVIDMLAEYGMDIGRKSTDPETLVVIRDTMRGIYVDPKKYVIPDADLKPEDRRLIVDSRIQPKLDDRIADTYIAIRVIPIQPSEKTLGYTIDLRHG